MWQRINGSNKFFQSFQVGMVRHGQSALKQQVRTSVGVELIRKNLLLVWSSFFAYG